MAALTMTCRTDPVQNRPFLRHFRGEDVSVLPEEENQWVEDWLDWCGLTEDELVRRHEENDFDYYRDYDAWAMTCGLMGVDADGRPIRARA